MTTFDVTISEPSILPYFIYLGCVLALLGLAGLLELIFKKRDVHGVFIVTAVTLVVFSIGFVVSSINLSRDEARDGSITEAVETSQGWKYFEIEDESFTAETKDGQYVRGSVFDSGNSTYTVVPR